MSTDHHAMEDSRFGSPVILRCLNGQLLDPIAIHAYLMNGIYVMNAIFSLWSNCTVAADVANVANVHRRVIHLFDIYFWLLSIRRECSSLCASFRYACSYAFIRQHRLELQITNDLTAEPTTRSSINPVE